MAALGPLEAVTLLSVIRIMVLKVFGSPVGGLKTSPSLPLPMAAPVPMPAPEVLVEAAGVSRVLTDALLMVT